MKIVIPTDISESTLKALKFLSSFKKSPSINVDLLFIETESNKNKSSFKLKDWKLGKAEHKGFSEKQISIISRIADNFLFVRKFICKNGDLEKEILKEANSGNYELLLSATQGVNSIGDLVFGSMTQHLVNDSEIPVLSLPENYRISDSKRMLLTSNFKIHEKSNFEHLKLFIEVFDLELHLLKVVEESKLDEVAVKSDIISYMSSNKLNYDQMHIKKARTVEEGIHHFLEEFDISICAMATHARHGIKHFFLGSMAEQLVDKMDVPLFTFRINSI